MSKTYRLIIFDLGNTVIRFDHHISAGAIASRFGIAEAKVYDAFFDSDITRSFESGKMTGPEFHVAMTGLLGIHLPYGEFVDIWSDIFFEDAKMAALVRRLKEHYKVCLMSNINELHYGFIRKRFDIVNEFDYVVLSYEVKAMKPDRRIFEHASRLSGVPFSEMLYIDDREDLVRHAGTYGIDSFRFQQIEGLEEWLIRHGVIQEGKR